jgi:hypothetical protein
MSRRALACAIAAALVNASATDAHASDHTNLEDRQPVTIADAYAANYLDREIQAIAGYRRTKQGADVFSFTPRFEVGFPRNAQISAEMPIVAVREDRSYAGRANAELLYNLNEETLVLPALAFVGAVDMPTGRDGEGMEARGFDPIVRAYLTKSIPGVLWWNRVHVNVSYQFNAARDAGERKGRYTLAGGYSFRIASSLIGIVDVVREQQMEADSVENYAELGFRYQANPLTVVSAGGGLGLDGKSPRGTLALQYRAF